MPAMPELEWTLGGSPCFEAGVSISANGLNDASTAGQSWLTMPCLLSDRCPSGAVGTGLPGIVGAHKGGVQCLAHPGDLVSALPLECNVSHIHRRNLYRLVTLGVLPFLAPGAALADSGLPPLSPTLDPPAITVTVVEPARKSPQAAPSTFPSYSHGEPTAEEQYMLELINRARANPAAEGLRLQATTDADIVSAYRYFQVDLGKLVADFAGYPPRPPLAFNANLIAAARGHSQDMADHDFQGHSGSDGSSFTDRIATAGYFSWNAVAENVYAYSDSVSHGHAGFVVDWGVPSLGHRRNIMNFSVTDPVYTEVGVGIISETSGTTAVGPLVVTEDFGRRSGQYFVVGVVYQDTNHDGFYSIGEGIGGVAVSTSQGNYAYTSGSGGYAIPLAATSGSVTVRAEGAVLGALQEYSVPLAGTNVKVDFIASIGSGYSRDYVQKAYVAYYGRPADPGGQTYWATRMDTEGQSLDAIIGAFGNSAEFNRRYGGLAYTQLVTKIYQQTLGRDPDPAGLAYYAGELESGRRSLQSITLDVLNGATTAPDSVVVANKLDVAAYYTAKVAVGCAYGTEQDGVDVLAIVTAFDTSVAGAKAAIDAGCGP